MSGEDALRSRIAFAICDSDGAYPERDYWDQADAVLALPEVAALLADAERMRRVRKLVAFYDRHEYSSLNVDDLREALDGDR